jgi:photosystem II stability/assembly factor-like uncharacterized protein
MYIRRFLEMRNYASVHMQNVLRIAICCCICFSAVSVFADWHAIPLVTAEQRKSGLSGGEGGQAIRTLNISEKDPQLLLMGTDVGGIYRSLDGARHWQICMSGWNARGGNAFAIDPQNPDRILGAGANGNDFGPLANGIYLSVDRGASWKPVLPRNDGNEWRRDSLAFDPASFDRARGFCTTAYFESRDGGLFKSVDGGEHWDSINKARTGAAMKVHPTRAFIYLADNSPNGHGFYKSADGGVTFRQINQNYTLGLDVISTQPDKVFIARWDKILVSIDAGETFNYVGRNAGLPDGVPIQDIRVNPADPKIMACKHGGAQWWESYAYSSADGGHHWEKIRYDNSRAFLPFTQPDEKCVFDPRDPKIVYSTTAAGWVTKSVDGGKNFTWCNEGQNAIMLGATFNFSVTHPRSIYLSFQDFGGATSDDQGKTWTFCNASGNGWGGFDYGGYTPDGHTLWCGDAPGWTGRRTLKMSRDGGKRWADVTDADHKPVLLGGSDISFSDPKQPAVYFASDFRSDDAGQHWKKMSGCDGVYTTNANGTVLLGKSGKRVCRSMDHGTSWTDITPPLEADIRDVALDEKDNRIFAIANERLKIFENGVWSTAETPKDQYGQIHLMSVATDPGDRSIIYTGGAANLYATSATITRSTDGGRTWTNLTANEPIKHFPEPPGPREVQWMRVHPTTHELWVNGECYGMWRWSPPR